MMVQLVLLQAEQWSHADVSRSIRWAHNYVPMKGMMSERNVWEVVERWIEEIIITLAVESQWLSHNYVHLKMSGVAGAHESIKLTGKCEDH